MTERNALPISERAARELLGQLLVDDGLDLVGAVVPLLLAGQGQRIGQPGLDGCPLDGLERIGLVRREDREVGNRLGGLRRQLQLGLAQRPEERLGGLQTLGDDLFGGRGGAAGDELDGVLGGLGLDHHDRDVVTGDATGDDHVEDGLLQLRVGRERDPLALDQGDPDAGNGAGERQAGDLGGRGRGVDREHVVQLVGVQRHDGDDDLDLVAQAGLEGRAQRTVDQPTGEDGVLGRAAFATEERSGDAPGGVHPLLDVDRQGEEVELLLRVLAGGGGAQQHGVLVEERRDGTGGLLGEPSGLEADGAGAERAVVDDG